MKWPLILVLGLIASSHTQPEWLLLRCPPLLLTSPTNSQSGIDLGNYNFSTAVEVASNICTGYQIEYLLR